MNENSNLINIIFILTLILLVFIIYKYYTQININTNLIYDFKPSSKIETNEIPKKIWTIWFSDTNVPDIVKLSLKTIKKNSPYYEHIHINLKNYKKYVTDPRIIHVIENENIGANFKSDLLRLYLIYNYGGCYFDASILLLQPIDFLIDNNYDLIMFKNIHHTTHSKTPVLESWFIAAKPNQDFLKISMEILLISLSDISKYFNMIKTDKNVDYQKFVNHKSYHLVYYIFIYVQNKYKLDYKAKFIENEKYGLWCGGGFIIFNLLKTLSTLRYLYTTPITNDEFINLLEKYKLIKFISDFRIFISKLTIEPNSFIDRLNKSVN